MKQPDTTVWDMTALLHNAILLCEDGEVYKSIKYGADPDIEINGKTAWVRALECGMNTVLKEAVDKAAIEVANTNKDPIDLLGHKTNWRYFDLIVEMAHRRGQPLQVGDLFKCPKNSQTPIIFTGIKAQALSKIVDWRWREGKPFTLEECRRQYNGKSMISAAAKYQQLGDLLDRSMFTSSRQAIHFCHSLPSNCKFQVNGFLGEMMAMVGAKKRTAPRP